MNKVTISLSIVSIVALVTSLSSCKKDEPTFEAAFTETTLSIDEGYKRKEITISFEKPVTADKTIQIRLTNNESSYNEDYTTTPAAVDDIISLPVSKDADEVTFLVSANLDLVNETNEHISFELRNLPNEFEAKNSLQLNIESNTLMQGLVGEYLFDGNGNDTSPTANHGTFHGAIASDDHLNAGNYALSFDGTDDYISMNDNENTDFGTSEDFAISLWALLMQHSLI